MATTQTVRELLPPAVYGAVEDHITQQAARAHRGWEAGSDEEDTLTGHLGASLQRDWSTITVNGAEWTWRMTYKKFRGRGPGAFERQIGADGILQLEVNLGVEIEFKGLLFQAKKIGQMNGHLAEQVGFMESVADRCSAVFEYGPDEYRAISGHDYLADADLVNRRAAPTLRPLGEFLGQGFLGCDFGVRGMYFDAVRRILHLPDSSAIRTSLDHRLQIEVFGATT